MSVDDLIRLDGDIGKHFAQCGEHIAAALANLQKRGPARMMKKLMQLSIEMEERYRRSDHVDRGAIVTDETHVDFDALCGEPLLNPTMKDVQLHERSPRRAS